MTKIYPLEIKLAAVTIISMGLVPLERQPKSMA
jgi:hypothetical protein